MTNKTYKNRNIRIFVSSTFQDMQDERDGLVSDVFPLLRKKAAERQVTLTEVDLRWGITEEESRNSKVIEICLEEIDKSHPFFIGLLGGRYGWAPQCESVEWDKRIPAKYHQIISDIDNGLSMTEMEIQYGVLRRNEMVHAAFYIKDCDEKSIEPNQKLLRNSIINQDKYPVSVYHDIAELKSSVISDFESLLDELYPLEEADSWEATIERQKAFLFEKTKFYVPCGNVEGKIESFIKNADKRGVIVTGESGLGKSTVMAKITLDLYDSEDNDVIAFFAGNTDHKSTYMDMIERISKGLVNLYGIDDSVMSVPYSERILKIASMIDAQRPLFIVIDGINQIISTSDDDNAWNWLACMPQNVHYIFSSIDSKIFNIGDGDGAWNKVSVAKLSLDNRVLLAQKYFNDYRKKLIPEQMDVIGADSDLMGNALLFMIVLDEMRKYGDFNTLIEFTNSMMQCSNVSNIFKVIFSNQERVLTLSESKADLKDIFSLIYVSESGLTENDIMAITGCSRLEVAEVVCMNNMSLVLRGDKVCIAHDMVREAIRSLWLDGKEEEFRKRIVGYFLSVNEDYGKMETAYQNFCLDDNDGLYKCISAIDSIRIFGNAGRINVLARYWQKLLLDFPERYDILGYLYNVIDDIDEDILPSDVLTSIFINIKINELSRLMDIITFNLHSPKIGLRLLYALDKNIRSEDNEGLKDWISFRMAILNSMGYGFVPALETYSKIINKDTTLDSYIIANIGELFLSMYEQTHKEDYLDNAIAVSGAVLDARKQKYGEEANTELASAYANYACAIGFRDKSESLDLHEKSLELYVQSKGYMDQDVAIQCHNMALNVWGYDDAKALKYARQSLDIYMQINGEDNYDTIQAMSLVGELLARENELDEALQLISRASSLMVNHQEMKDDYYRIYSLLVNVSFKAMQYDLALEAAEKALDTLDSENDKAVTIYGNMGKIYHKKHLPEKSREYYEKAIATAESIGEYVMELDQYKYIAHSLWESEQREEAMSTLETAIRKTEDYGLDGTFHMAYFLYNHAILIMFLLGDKGKAVSEIKKAIEILENKDADRYEKDLNEYRAMLEKFGGCEDVEEKENSISLNDIEYPQCAEMKEYLNRDYEEAEIAFNKGISAFEQGIIEAAIYQLERTKNLLADSDNNSAKSLTLQYLAYSYEKTLHASMHKCEKEDVVIMYNDSLRLADEVRNYALAQRVCHDTAEFYWYFDDFHSAEQFYWYEIRYNVLRNEIPAESTIRALSNISAAKEKTDEETSPYVMLALNAFAFLLLPPDGQSDEKYACIRRSIEYYMKYCDYEDDELSGYGYHTLVLAKYLFNCSFERHYTIAAVMANLSAGYFKQINNKNFIAESTVLHFKCLNAMGYGSSIIKDFDSMEEEWNEGVDDDILYDLALLKINIYLSFFNYECAEALCREYGIDRSCIDEFNEERLPCYYAFSTGDFDKAENIYNDLEKTDLDDLYIQEIYDMLIYCMKSGKQYQARHLLNLWQNRIENLDDDDIKMYMPAHTKIKKMLNETK